jgi:hypothetical protein
MKLTRDRLRQIIKEELEEVYRDISLPSSGRDEKPIPGSAVPTGPDTAQSQVPVGQKSEKTEQQKQIDAEAQRLYDEYMDKKDEQELWNNSKMGTDIIKTAAMLQAFGKIKANKLNRLMKK